MSSTNWFQVSDRKLHKAALTSARAQRQQAKSYKQFLEASYSFPGEVVSDHAINWAPRPLPPLHHLCPTGGFHVLPWPGLEAALDQWYQGLDDKKQAYSCSAISPPLSFTLLRLALPFMNYVDIDLKAFKSNGIPRPELYIYSLITKLPLLLCLFDLDNLRGVEQPPQFVLDRLFNYMQLAAGTKFALLTSVERTWVCKKSDSNQLLVSAAMDAPAKALGYLISLSQSSENAASTATENGNGIYDNSSSETQGKTQNVLPLTATQSSQKQSSENAASTATENGNGIYDDSSSETQGKTRNDANIPRQTPQTQFDIQPVMAILESLCLKLGARYTAKIVDGIDTTFDLKNLSNARMLRYITEHTSLSVFKGTYKGQNVVVKIRDLTCPWWRGFEGSLGRMVAEVDTYLNLYKLQKSGYFPTLISWGFICGAMFAYVMTSDGGMSRHQRLGDHQPLMRGSLENVQVALHELHKRGILHGDVDISKVVFQQQEGGVIGKLVGFAESKHVNVTDPDDALAMGLEKAKLAEVLGDLTSGGYVG